MNDQMIPAHIIQTGPTAKKSVLAEAAMYTVRSLNPEFTYLFFNDEDVEDFIAEHFKEHRSVFHSFPYAVQKYDFFRYLAVYHYGGFYFDQDVLLARSLTPLLRHACVFPFEEITFNEFLRVNYGMDWEIGNYAFGAAPGHPFMEALINNCVRAQVDPEWAAAMLKPIPRFFRRHWYVLYTTGPGIVSRTYAEEPHMSKHVNVLVPEEPISPESWNHFGDYGVHLASGDWREASGGFFPRALKFFRKRWFDRKRARQLRDSRNRIRGGVRGRE